MTQRLQCWRCAHEYLMRFIMNLFTRTWIINEIRRTPGVDLWSPADSVEGEGLVPSWGPPSLDPCGVWGLDPGGGGEGPWILVGPGSTLGPWILADMGRALDPQGTHPYDPQGSPTPHMQVFYWFRIMQKVCHCSWIFNEIHSNLFTKLWIFNEIHSNLFTDIWIFNEIRNICLLMRCNHSRR